MKVDISQTRTNQQGFELIARLYEEAKDLSFDTVELNFSSCSWFDANMAAPLGGILTLLSDEFNGIEIQGVSPGIESILCKNEFLSHYGYSKRMDSYGTVVPYRRFDLSDERIFAAYITKYSAGKGIPTMTPLLKRKFHESIGELFANAMMHSTSRRGVFCCGQYFPQKNRFDMCIADTGSGFVGAIYNAFQLKVDSLKAMKFCLKEGNTTKQDEPGGLGLKLLKQFISLNRGRIVIVSNQAYYEYAGNEEQFHALGCTFPGTCVNLEINTADYSSYRLSSEPSENNK